MSSENTADPEARESPWIKRIRVTGFQGERTVSLSFDRQTNFLIGRNGCGKTTLINLVNAGLSGDTAALLRARFETLELTMAQQRAPKTFTLSYKQIFQRERGAQEVQFELLGTRRAILEKRVIRDRDHIQYQANVFRNVYADTPVNQVKQALEAADITIPICTWLSIHRGDLHISPTMDNISQSPIDRKIDELVNRTARYLSSLDNRASALSADFQKESDPNNPVEACLDAGFWTKVLTVFRPDLTFIVRQIGSCENVIAVARALRNVNKSHTLCVLDRDFSDLHGEHIAGGNVIYTYGYSIENDMNHVSILCEAIDYSIPGPTSINEIKKRLQPIRDGIFNDLRRVVLADQMLSFYYLSLIPRSGQEFRRLFEIAGAHDPATLCRPRVIELLRHQKARRVYGRPVGRPTIDNETTRRAFGHMVWWLIFRMCRHVLRTFGHKQTLSEMSFSAIVLARFEHALRDPAFALEAYYRQAVASATLAAIA